MRKRPLLAVTLAIAASGALACGSSPSTEGATCAAPYDALIVASDYSRGSSAIGGCMLDGGAALPFAGVNLGADPALAVSRGRAFYIARDEDVLYELDAACASPKTQLSTKDPAYGGTANAQDVAAARSGDLWVPRFDVPRLLVLGAKGDTDTIDLSSHDTDGNPNMSAIRIEDTPAGEKAFVALERLDDVRRPDGIFVSRQPSTLVRIDVASRAVEAEATLAGRDPFGAIAAGAGAYFFAEPGNFDAANEDDAGIERFDPVAFGTTWLLKESALGASVAAVAVNGSCGVAIVADPTPNVNATSLVTFDADRGTPITTATNPIYATAGFDLSALAWHGDTLLLGDRRPGANGRYPIHRFEKTGACDLALQPDTIFVAQKPVAARSTAP